MDLFIIIMDWFFKLTLYFYGCSLTVFITINTYEYYFFYMKMRKIQEREEREERQEIQGLEEVEILEEGMKQAEAYITPVVEASIVKYQIIPRAHANLVL